MIYIYIYIYMYTYIYIRCTKTHTAAAHIHVFSNGSRASFLDSFFPQMRPDKGNEERDLYSKKRR